MLAPIMEFHFDPNWPGEITPVVASESYATYVQGARQIHRPMQHFLWFIVMFLSTALQLG